MALVYSPQVLDHFERPRNSGVLDEPDASVRLENPACGDVLQLTAKFAGEVISDIRFRAKGCVPAIACGSAITDLARGMNLTDAAAITREQLLMHLGSLPKASAHASHLAIDALALLLKNYTRKRVPLGQ
jgi:nitrogen fixation NifU-like protein